MYCEEQHKQWKKVEKEDRLVWETEQQRRRDDPKTWEYHIAKVEEKNRHVKEVECEGMTFEAWPQPRPKEGTFCRTLCKFEDWVLWF
jgi:hypothetical protein